MTLKKTDFSVKGQKRPSDFQSLLDGHVGRNTSNATINGYIVCCYILFFFLSMLSSLYSLSSFPYLVSSGPLDMFNCSASSGLVF